MKHATTRPISRNDIVIADFDARDFFRMSRWQSFVESCEVKLRGRFSPARRLRDNVPREPNFCLALQV